MADRTQQPVTVRLDKGLHRQATAIAAVLGETFRDFVESGLRREIRERIKEHERLGLEHVRRAGDAAVNLK